MPMEARVQQDEKHFAGWLVGWVPDAEYGIIRTECDPRGNHIATATEYFAELKKG